MGQQTINNGDTGLSARTKINENFTEVYNPESITVGSTGTLPITPTNVGSRKSNATASGAKVNGVFYIDQTVATSGSAQGVEGYVKTSNPSGSVVLGIGAIGNIEHSGAGTLDYARPVQAGGIVSGNGTVTEWAAFYAQPVAITGGGTITNVFGLYLDTASAGGGTITNRYGVYQVDPNAVNLLKGITLLGGTTITPSAILDIQSTTHAFIPPRMTTTQRNAIASPSAGMVIYNTDTDNLNLYTTGWGEIGGSSGTEILDVIFEDFTNSYSSISAGSFNNGGGLGGTPATSVFGVDNTENASGVMALGTSSSTAGGSSMHNITYLITFGFGFIHTLEFRAALETLSDGTNTYIVRLGFMDAYTTTGAIVDGAYFRYTHGTNSGRWEAVTVSNGSETAEDTGVTADVNTYHVFKIQANAAGTQVDFYIDGVKTNDITSDVINSSARVTGKVATIEKTAGSTARNLYVDYMRSITARTSAR